jgi:hypothetical protein
MARKKKQMRNKNERAPDAALQTGIARLIHFNPN